MSLLAVVLGAVAGLGAVVTALAVRGVEPHESRAPVAPAPTGARIERLTVRLAVAVVAGVAIGALTRWPVAALLVAVAGFLAPGLLGGRHERERLVARIEGIASWSEMLRDTLAGAGGLEQSIIASAGVAPEAIRPEVQRLAARLERDRLGPALRDFAEELDDPTGDLVVAALVLAADKSPKRLGSLLGTLAASARDEVNMRLRVDAGRARTRASVKVVTVATAVFTIGLIVLNRQYLDPYDSAFGQVMLLLIGACFALAFWWLARAAKFEPQERFLGADLGQRVTA